MSLSLDDDISLARLFSSVLRFLDDVKYMSSWDITCSSLSLLHMEDSSDDARIFPSSEGTFQSSMAINALSFYRINIRAARGLTLHYNEKIKID